MSHQDRMSTIVIDHDSIKQVLDWLLAPALFAGMKVHGLATWKPRMLAATALFWAMADETNLTERFELSHKIVNKVFRWQPSPGTTYQGFMKMLRKWHVEWMLVIVPDVRAKMKEVLPGQWEIAGYLVCANISETTILARRNVNTSATPKSPTRPNNKSTKRKHLAHYNKKFGYRRRVARPIRACHRRILGVFSRKGLNRGTFSKPWAVASETRKVLRRPVRLSRPPG